LKDVRPEVTLKSAFVRLNMPEGEPEFWIVPSFTVATMMVDSDKVWMSKKN